jgi:hypothetical protein
MPAGIAPKARPGELGSGFCIVTCIGVAVPILGVGFAAHAVGLLTSVRCSPPRSC